MYQEKYDEFQQTLTKSNDVFQNFKNEMDKVFLLHPACEILCTVTPETYCCKII